MIPRTTRWEMRCDIFHLPAMRNLLQSLPRSLHNMDTYICTGGFFHDSQHDDSDDDHAVQVHANSASACGAGGQDPHQVSPGVLIIIISGHLKFNHHHHHQLPTKNKCFDLIWMVGCRDHPHALEQLGPRCGPIPPGARHLRWKWTGWWFLVGDQLLTRHFLKKFNRFFQIGDNSAWSSTILPPWGGDFDLLVSQSNNPHISRGTTSSSGVFCV